LEILYFVHFQNRQFHMLISMLIIHFLGIIVLGTLSSRHGPF
jgi:hypothetical protein